MHLLARDLDLLAAADQPRAGPGQVDGQPLGGVGAQQRLLQLPAGLHQHGPVPRLELAARLPSVPVGMFGAGVPPSPVSRCSR